MQADLKIAAANVQDAFAVIDPSKIVTKIKLHLLPHIPDDARSLGPLVGAATETFEAFNSVFRAASVFSNHLAPSRDIAYRLADQESTKHHLGGGLWPSADGSWSTAGAGVLDLIQDQPVLCSMVGCTAATEDLVQGMYSSLQCFTGY